MTTIKSYTDIEQSKKLAEILPLESADMAYYQWKNDGHLMSPVPFVLDGMEEKEDGMFNYIPCWSLATLLGKLTEQNFIIKTIGNEFNIDIPIRHCKIWFSSLLDAAFEMIVWLKENGNI